MVRSLAIATHTVYRIQCHGSPVDKQPNEQQPGDYREEHRCWDSSHGPGGMEGSKTLRGHFFKCDKDC